NYLKITGARSRPHHPTGGERQRPAVATQRGAVDRSRRGNRERRTVRGQQNGRGLERAPLARRAKTRHDRADAGDRRETGRRKRVTPSVRDAEAYARRPP